MEQADEIASWIDRFTRSQLALKRETTRAPYGILLRQFLTWLKLQPGRAASFDPATMTATAVQTYLFTELSTTSISHRERTKSILSGFANWLIDEGLINRNPTHGISFLPSNSWLREDSRGTSATYSKNW